MHYLESEQTRICICRVDFDQRDFPVVHLVVGETKRLQAITKSALSTYSMGQSLNTRALQQCHVDIMKDYSSHTVCLNEARIKVEQDSMDLVAIGRCHRF